MLVDRHVEAGDVGAAFAEFPQCVQAAHHGEFQRNPGGLGQHPGQRRQREVVTRGDAQAQCRPLLGSSLRGAELDREPRQDPREPLRGRLLRPDQLRSGRGEARAAAAFEQHQRRAELPVVIAQESPGGAVGNAAGRNRRGKGSRGRDRFQQWQQAVVERFVGVADEMPTQGRHEFHYAKINIFWRGARQL